jgi:hypothetical protein
MILTRSKERGGGMREEKGNEKRRGRTRSYILRQEGRRQIG